MERHMRYNTSLKGADNCFFPAFEPRVIVLWCRISLHVEGLLWSWVQSRRHRVRLNLFLLIRSPVPSLPTWLLCRKHVIVFYLVPLFSRFSHFPFGTFVALETQRERGVSSIWSRQQNDFWCCAKQLRSSTDLHARKARVPGHPRWTRVWTLNDNNKK